MCIGYHFGDEDENDYAFEFVDIDVDTIPDSDTREDDLARIIDAKGNPIMKIDVPNG